MRSFPFHVLWLSVGFGLFACYDVASLTSANDGIDGGGEGQPDGASVVDASDDTAAVVEGGADTSTPVDAGPSWKLYSRSIFSPTQWNVVDVAAVWSGANAPPSRDITVVVQLNIADRLLVFTADTLYVRADGTWRAPQSLSTVMPLLVGKSFHGALHTPEVPSDGGPAQTELVTLSENPTAFVYRTNGDTFSFADTRTLSDAQPPNKPAPQGSKRSRWAVTLIDDAKKGSAAYLTVYEAYAGDPNIYFFDASPGWTNMWDAASCPLFAGTNGAPPFDDIMAGYNDDKVGTMYFVVR